ncbi:hypothetical protein [Thomasclavelia spiroformis]|uniref:hypothetical protein n=1 Tax=Thomasclavelia spiroformis TaxID=29348 RepID=UPI003999C794
MNNDYIIYPKQFRSVRILTEKNYCFFLMPFDAEFDGIYGSIKEQLMDSGYVCNRADELSGSKPIINKILTEILKAQYLIVDLTGCNPNVFYELGIAHTFKDAQNVLLIKQKDSKVPFDITHLQYKEYSPNNLKQLASIIKEFISQNKYIGEFYEALNIRGIIRLVHDNHEDFIDWLRHNLKEDIISITAILNLNYNEVDSKKMEEVLDRYQLFMHKVIDLNRTDLLPGIFKLYAELLLSCNDFKLLELQVTYFFYSFFSRHEMTHQQVIEIQTDLAIALAEKGKILSVVMPWIIEYFTRSKSASIDLNRYKLEGFLMTTQLEEVNKILTNAIFDKDCHIREHIADIIGEKRLQSAQNTLCCQLRVEENYYTAVSLIEALGKIGYTEGLPVILNWISENKQEIIKTKMFSVFRHCQIAIAKLDISPNETFIKQFEREYREYISENVPL